MVKNSLGNQHVSRRMRCFSSGKAPGQVSNGEFFDESSPPQSLVLQAFQPCYALKSLNFRAFHLTDARVPRAMGVPEHFIFHDCLGFPIASF
jgi:hypothetical protein